MAEKNKIFQMFLWSLGALFSAALIFASFDGVLAAEARMGAGGGRERILSTDSELNDKAFLRDPATGDQMIRTPPGRPGVLSSGQRYNFAPEINMDVNWWLFPRPLPGPTPKPYEGVSPSTNLLPGVTGPSGGGISAGKDLSPPRAQPGESSYNPRPGQLPNEYSRPMPGRIPGAGSRPAPGALPGQGY